jgi:hypothetical protein
MSCCVSGLATYTPSSSGVRAREPTVSGTAVNGCGAAKVLAGSHMASGPASVLLPGSPPSASASPADEESAATLVEASAAGAPSDVSPLRLAHPTAGETTAQLAITTTRTGKRTPRSYPKTESAKSRSSRRYPRSTVERAERWAEATRSRRSIARSSIPTCEGATPEPHESAFTHASYDGLEIDEHGRRRSVKCDAAVGVAHEDAVEQHDVHVHVHVHVQAIVGTPETKTAPLAEARGADFTLLRKETEWGNRDLNPKPMD